MQLKNQNRWLLAILILILLVSRAALLFEGIIPFAFDHGKDSLAIMKMVATFSPSLIGPWTSIPGLYFGPGWYYLLAPFYLIGGYHPLSAVVAMVLLLAVQVVIAFKYFGKWSALIIVAAPFWFMLSTSAWNPFPMTLISLLLVVLLSEVEKYKCLIPLHAFMIGLTASAGFHFSSAYAIFYPTIVVLFLVLRKIPIPIKSVLASATGFGVPFIPQLIFEIRNNFVQTQAVIGYFQKGEPHEFGLDKITYVLITILSELKHTFLPEMRGFSNWSSTSLQLLLLSSIGVGIWRNRLWNDTVIKRNILLTALFVLLPALGYQFLHFNVWYVYAMAPVMAVVIGSILSRSPKWVQGVWLAGLLVSVITLVLNFHTSNKYELMQSRTFLPIKMKALSVIREKAANRPFASYHYVPDIYDFSYQYLYFYQAFQGQALPTQFAYEPNVVPYVIQKDELLALFPSEVRKPEVLFYITESPVHDEFLDQWWQRQQFGGIIETIELSDEVTLYVATPSGAAAETE